MKTYIEYIKESFDSVSAFNRHGNLKIDRSNLYYKGTKIGDATIFAKDYIKLDLIRIDKEHQRQGFGDMFMNQITKMADAVKMKIALTPSNDFGSGKERLKKWYKKYGFKKNKDYSITDTMVREPV